MRVVNCNTLTWDHPGDGVTGYRIRVYNGRTYGASTERSILRVTENMVTLTSLPSEGSVFATVGNAVCEHVHMCIFSLATLFAWKYTCMDPTERHYPLHTAFKYRYLEL